LPEPQVLVVEDVELLAEALCDFLLEAGFSPVGPAAGTAIALELIGSSNIDAAILDIRLVGETSYPVAYRLREQRIPFLFLTANQTHDLPEDLRDTPCLRKPFQATSMLAAMRELLAPGATS
jgi:DNA-binding response OmpR family regulator